MTGREFESIFRMLYLPLGMYALRTVGTAEAAEDIAQEVFIKAWQALEGGVEIANIKAYLYRSVRNECISYLRAQKETVDINNILEVTEEDVDTSERDARIWAAIDKLPERCREIFLLSKRDGLSNEEIADELGLSVKTVKNQLTKAFSRLRDALAPGHKPFFLPFL